MVREASWSRSNSSWGISQFKRPNDILAASSGFDQRSMTISVSSRILEIAEGLPTIHPESAGRERHFYVQPVTWRFDLKSIRYPSTGSAGRAQPLELSSEPPLP